MTAAEKKAFEAGRTVSERGLAGKAPCYDPIMMGLMVNARSERGIAYNGRILAAWHAGAGIELPQE